MSGFGGQPRGGARPGGRTGGGSGVRSGLCIQPVNQLSLSSTFLRGIYCGKSWKRDDAHICPSASNLVGNMLMRRSNVQL